MYMYIHIPSTYTYIHLISKTQIKGYFNHNIQEKAPQSFVYTYIYICLYILNTENSHVIMYNVCIVAYIKKKRTYIKCVYIYLFIYYITYIMYV